MVAGVLAVFIGLGFGLGGSALGAIACGLGATFFLGYYFSFVEPIAGWRWGLWASAFFWLPAVVWKNYEWLIVGIPLFISVWIGAEYGRWGRNKTVAAPPSS